MKTTKFLSIMLAAFALAFTAVSCSSDDDNNKEVETVINESADQIVAKLNVPGVMTSITTCKFNAQGICIEAYEEDTYASAAIADKYEALYKRSGMNLRREGNTIYYTTNDIVGMSRESVKKLLTSNLNETKQAIETGKIDPKNPSGSLVFDYSFEEAPDHSSIVAKYNSAGICDVLITAKFKNGLATECYQTMTFPAPEMASAAYEQSKKQAENSQGIEISLNGNVVMFVYTGFVGMPYETVKGFIQQTIETIKNGAQGGAAAA